MRPAICLGVVLLIATPVWSQLGVIPYETSAASIDEESQMQIPPPVSGVAYPTMVESEIRSNYLAAGLIFKTSYADDVIVSGGGVPMGDIIYSILPTVAFNKNTPRQQMSLTYSPGFTLYQHTSGLDAANQNAALDFRCRPSQHTTITVSDSFQKTSNVFDQLYPSSGGGISGSVQSSSSEVVAPYANRLQNAGNAGLSYQFSRNGMIGASGVVSESGYSNSAEAPGLYNSHSQGGLVFYSQRLSNTQYFGVNYQYLESQSGLGNTHTKVQTHALAPFYTVYLSATLSLSLSVGPQYFDATQSSSPPSHSWTPSATASIGWQANNTNFVVIYSRSVSGDTGLPGVYSSYNATTSARWRLTRMWTIGFSASYFSNKNVTPLFSSSIPGGHTVSGTASAERSLSEHFKAELGYARLHQSYNGIAVIDTAPDRNQVSISISYQLTRPLGR